MPTASESKKTQADDPAPMPPDHLQGAEKESDGILQETQEIQQGPASGDHGIDIVYDLPISFSQAAVGAEGLLTIHTEEASLERIFIEMTGRGLAG